MQTGFDRSQIHLRINSSTVSEFGPIQCHLTVTMRIFRHMLWISVCQDKQMCVNVNIYYACCQTGWGGNLVLWDHPMHEYKGKPVAFIPCECLIHSFIHSLLLTSLLSDKLKHRTIQNHGWLSVNAPWRFSILSEAPLLVPGLHFRNHWLSDLSPMTTFCRLCSWMQFFLCEKMIILETFFGGVI